MAAGRVRFCLGYSDPEGGSDIAAAHLRAVPDGDEWVLNGAKMFTTGAHNCQYTFLITRTDPALPKHKGLTMFLVPLDVPGVEIQAIRTYGGERTNAVYYADVHVPDRYRMGGVNDGWAVAARPARRRARRGRGHGRPRPTSARGAATCACSSAHSTRRSAGRSRGHPARRHAGRRRPRVPGPARPPARRARGRHS